MKTFRKASALNPGMPVPSGVFRDDGAFIPADPDNIDWQAYQAWLAAGNTPDEPAPPPAAG